MDIQRYRASAPRSGNLSIAGIVREVTGPHSGHLSVFGWCDPQRDRKVTAKRSDAYRSDVSYREATATRWRYRLLSSSPTVCGAITRPTSLNLLSPR